MSPFEKAETLEIEAAMKRQATPEHEQAMGALATKSELPEFGRPFGHLARLQSLPDCVFKQHGLVLRDPVELGRDRG